MAGQLTPLVMVPRYSTFAGRHGYSTIPIDVSDYSKAVLTCWRGPINLGGTFAFNSEESSDQETWATCSGTNFSFDPGANGEGIASVNLKRRWFRLIINLQGETAIQKKIWVTCWAVGHLVRREP